MLTYEPSNYERAVLTFPRAHSITQAVGDSAVIVSRDQESELMSSLKAPCKNPIGRKGDLIDSFCEYFMLPTSDYVHRSQLFFVIEKTIFIVIE